MELNTNCYQWMRLNFSRFIRTYSNIVSKSSTEHTKSQPGQELGFMGYGQAQSHCLSQGATYMIVHRVAL